MPGNQISDVTLRPVAGDAEGDAGAGGGHALFLGLELADPGQLAGFLEDVVTRFKRERMTGPPDTRFMLITVTGEVTAAEFALAWHGAIANDVPARALMGTMQQADVMQRDLEDRMIGQVSLLAAPDDTDAAS